MLRWIRIDINIAENFVHTVIVYIIKTGECITSFESRIWCERLSSDACRHGMGEEWMDIIQSETEHVQSCASRTLNCNNNYDIIRPNNIGIKIVQV